jgi:hypothetical protein
MTGNPLDHFQRARINFIQYRLHLSKAGVLPSLRENFSVLTSRPGFAAKMPFSLSQENSIPIADICCLIVAGRARVLFDVTATVIGSISSRPRKPARWQAFSACGAVSMITKSAP